MTLSPGLTSRQRKVIQQVVGERRWRIQKLQGVYTADNLESQQKVSFTDRNFDRLIKKVKESIQQQEMEADK